MENTEYSNALATKGYLVLSIQHDLPTDAPLVTVEGALYAGRLPIYERGEANIDFVLGEMGTTTTARGLRQFDFVRPSPSSGLSKDGTYARVARQSPIFSCYAF